MFLIYGSTAKQFHFPTSNQPKDFDVISDIKSNTEYENYNIDGLFEDVVWYDELNAILKMNKGDVYMDKNLLYTFKLSHAMYDINWNKTIGDLIFFKNNGCQVDEKCFDILSTLWKRIHTRNKIKLNKSKNEFFDNAIRYVIPHDDLHHLLFINNEPMYKKILIDDNSVKTSKTKFELLSHQHKINTVIEEICVLAVERLMIYNVSLHSRLAKSKMLHHFVTKMSSGYFNRFILENIEEIIHWSDDDYFDKMRNISNVLSKKIK